jgi:L-threonylcarbamoyladenylate synthase
MAQIGKDIELAGALLEKGDLVAIPTETVYGLAGNAFSEKAILKIFDVKKRPLSDPLILHISGTARLPELVTEIPPLARALFEAFSPGPLTILLPKSHKVPDLVTHGSPLVAIRIPDHPLTLELLERLPFPLVAPSANLFGGLSPTLPGHVEQSLGNVIPYILDGGPCRVGLESTIIRINNQNEIQILRQGGISEETLRLFASLASGDNKKNQEVVPGSMLSHYAPRKPLYISDFSKVLHQYGENGILYLAFSNEQEKLPGTRQRVLSRSGNPDEAARNLFSFLHELDQMPGKAIFAEQVPDSGLGKAINDRLKRASVKRSG